MNKLVIDYSVRKKFSPGLNRGKTIVKEIVVHGTAGGKSASGIIKWMLGGERAAEYVRGVSLFHYIIDYDGTTYEIIDPKNWVYHSSSGIHDKETIGIELMNKSNTNSDGYTEEQYKALAELITYIGKSFAEIERITTHRYNINHYSNQDKICPGDKFSFDTLKIELLNKGVISTTIKEGIAI